MYTLFALANLELIKRYFSFRIQVLYSQQDGTFLYLITLLVKNGIDYPG